MKRDKNHATWFIQICAVCVLLHSLLFLIELGITAPFELRAFIQGVALLFGSKTEIALLPQ